MQEKRIIPCLDVREGRVVKGINFINIRDVGDPVLCAMEYEKQGADELTLLDITATVEGRQTMADVVRNVAEKISIPLTIGGGIRTVEDFRRLFDAGASKVAINSAAVGNPELIREAAQIFGSKSVVLAVDAKLMGTDKDTGEAKFNVFVSAGRVDTGLDLAEWVRRGSELGAGEVLPTSMDRDGTRDGFDITMLNVVCGACDLPVVASGGGSGLDSFVEVFEKTSVSAALAASVFHFGELTVGDVKRELRSHGIPVRWIAES